MPIPLTCQCATALEVPDAFAGKTTMCPQCGTFLDVPDPKERPAARADRDAEEDEKSEELSPRELKRLVRDAFEGDIRPVRRTAGYHLGVACGAAVMLVLPALYIGLIVLVAVLLYWHATTNHAVFKVFRFYLAALFYVVPLLVGVVLLVFMLKPLLARPPRARRGRLVRLDREPVLAAFVADIARVVHAPKPARIEVDCQVNASAGLGRGLFGLFGRDLTLTVGLPLVVGLTARQFAGVLAHEFGHFSQGAGMRLSFVVRSVNAWFARVVYERDAWDEDLIEWCKEPGLAGLVGWAVRMWVAGTRAILWVFMMVAHGLSCFLLRRMEYDADRSEVRLVGIGTFEKTSRRMAVLEAGAAEATEIVEGCWLKDRFPDDFAALVVGLADQMPVRDRRRVEQELEEAWTWLFDTHPSFTDRLASVDEEDEEDARGVFRLDLPAAALFRDLPKLTESATLAHYRGMFGGGLQATLRPVADYLSGRVS